jgi:NitT/TauT family transport system ATP-binding protein
MPNDIRFENLAGTKDSTKIELRHLRQIFLVRNQEKKRTEEFIAIEDFTLSVEEGAFIAIVGPSGCGKSTLLDIIAGQKTEGDE